MRASDPAIVPPPETRSAFSRGEWAGIGLLTSVFLLMVAALGVRSLAVSERERIDEAATAMLQAAGQRVVEVRGVMNAMLGVHYASDEFAGSDIAAFAEQLRNYSDFVEAMGMFTLLDGQLRVPFSNFMRAKLDQKFTIVDWSPGGRRFAAGERALHLPITRVDPLDDIGTGLLGTDLAGDPALQRRIQDAVASGEPFLATIPLGWPYQTDLAMLQPVYATAQPPVTREERVESWVGGVWFTLDLASLLGHELTNMPHAEVVLTLSPAEGEPLTMLARGALARPGGMATGREPAGDSRSWSVGDTVLSMRVEQPVRISAEHGLRIVWMPGLALLLAFVSIAYVHQRRVMRRQRARGEAELAAERDKAARTLEAISDAVLMVDTAGVILYLNPSAARIVAQDGTPVGRGVDTVLDLCELTGSRCAPVSFHALVERLEQAAGGPSDRRRSAPATSSPLLELDVRTGVQANDQRLALALSRLLAPSIGYLLVLQDVSKERELTAELEHRAHHDAMTGCFNRFYFERHLEALVDELAETERRHALCYIDLDQFKIVNDTCGHAAGDRLLCELTEALALRLRGTDVLARLGGDEFGVIICDVNAEQAVVVAEKLYAYFQTAMFEHEGNVFPTRASMGLVEIGERNRDMKQIMKAADIACYTAKDGGRNALVIYSEDDVSMNQRQEEMNWLPVLERALAEDRFRLLMQPIASVSGHDDDGEPHPAVRHHELLLRLIDDDGTELTPGRFIRAAERYDLMRAIDRWVIDHAMRLVAADPGRFDPSITFSINLSGQSAADPSVLPFIAGLMEELGLEPSRFWFEITETAAISHFSTAVALIDGIHELGARVALDDFGAGLSSFVYLRDLPVDVLKIDGQIVKDIATDPVAREMVRAMVQIGRSMSLQTVAEFVEDAAIMNELADLKVDLAQGWHIGRPVDVDVAFPRQARSRRA